MIVTVMNDCLRVADSIMMIFGARLAQQLATMVHNTQNINISNNHILFADSVNDHKRLFDLNQGTIFNKSTGITLFYQTDITQFATQLSKQKDKSSSFLCILQQETQYNMQRIHYILQTDPYLLPSIDQCEIDLKSTQTKAKLFIYQCSCNSGNMYNIIQQIKSYIQLSIEYKKHISIIVNFRDFLCSRESLKQSNVYSQMYQMNNKRQSRNNNQQVSQMDNISSNNQQNRHINNLKGYGSSQQSYKDKLPSQQLKHINTLIRPIVNEKYLRKANKSTFNDKDDNIIKLLIHYSKQNIMRLPIITDILYEKKDLDYINKYCIYTQQEIFENFVQNTLYSYQDSREFIGNLFEFSTPFSSYQSPFISLGIVSTRQIFAELDINAPGKALNKLLKKVQSTNGMNLQTLKGSIVKYQQELLWNDFCHLYWLTNRQQLIKQSFPLYIELNSGGLYNRVRKWQKNNKLLHQFEYGLLDDKYALINAAMNQLRIQGYMSNYLRMIVASCAMQFHLDWRDVLLLFEKYLVDISWSSNIYGWLFSYNFTAGQPHTFNIQKQTIKRDKYGIYIDKWTDK